MQKDYVLGSVHVSPILEEKLKKFPTCNLSTEVVFTSHLTTVRKFWGQLRRDCLTQLLNLVTLMNRTSSKTL